MSPYKRITRKEIKKDRLVTTTFQATEYIQKHKQPFIIGIAAIAAAVLLAYFFYGSKEGKKTDAVEQLGMGDLSLASGDYNTAIAEYEETVSKYGSTISGRKAYILLGKTYNNVGNYQKAKEIFQEYLNKFGDGKPALLHRSALVGLAVALRNLDEKGEAAQNYEKAIKADASKEETAYLLFDAAKCYRESGNNEKSLELYRRIKDEYQFTVYMSKAEREISNILIQE